MKWIRRTSLAAATLLTCGLAAAQDQPATPTAQPLAVTPGWMHTDVGQAWDRGFKGQGVTLTVVDDFRSTSAFRGQLDGSVRTLRHGEWTSLEASLIAPSARLALQDFRSGTAVQLNPGLNVINLSYGMMARSGYRANQIGWSAQEGSLINAARDGRAVVVKAAGNDGVPLLGSNRQGQTDYLNLALRGTKTAIYVGALTTNGSPTARTTLASYSNTPGSDKVAQSQFLVVGVTGSQTGLYGTSFAAPVVSAYAAILGSKFTQANAQQITRQLLGTARQDTIAGYKASLHGRGEASLSRALAPTAIR